MFQDETTDTSHHPVELKTKLPSAKSMMKLAPNVDSHHYRSMDMSREPALNSLMLKPLNFPPMKSHNSHHMNPMDASNGTMDDNDRCSNVSSNESLPALARSNLSSPSFGALPAEQQHYQTPIHHSEYMTGHGKGRRRSSVARVNVTGRRKSSVHSTSVPHGIPSVTNGAYILSSDPMNISTISPVSESHFGEDGYSMDGSLTSADTVMLTGRRGDKPCLEVPCNICGKRYKNQICLQKHAWEHHQSWPYAKRLMLNKHQSVQIMEAAQSLIMMMSGVEPESYEFSMEQRDMAFHSLSNMDPELDDQDGWKSENSSEDGTSSLDSTGNIKNENEIATCGLD